MLTRPSIDGFPGRTQKDPESPGEYPGLGSRQAKAAEGVAAPLLHNMIDPALGSASV